MPLKRKLAGHLKRHDVVVSRRRKIADWPETSSLLYVRSLNSISLIRAAAYEAAWRSLFGESPGELWELDGEKSYRHLLRDKNVLRRAGENLKALLLITTPSESAVKRPITLHPFHVPDPEYMASEYTQIAALLTRTISGA